MIYVLLADGFEETEAIEPIDIIRRAGLDVQTVGMNAEYVKGAHGITVKADIGFDRVEKDKTDMLILPGGPGHTALDSDKRVHDFIDYCSQKDIYIAAICAAPSIPGKMGLTEGKRVTCFPGYEQYMKGAELTGEKAVTDGKIITAKGAGAAGDFGFKIVEALAGAEKAADIRKAMQY